MDNILFTHFPPIGVKQWKQKIQFLLHGEDYQNLIHIDSDGISTLPFYTKNGLHKKLITENKPVSKAGFYCIVTKESKANIEAQVALKNGIQTVYFAIFNPNINLAILLQNIDCQIFLHCYFLDYEFFNNPLIAEKKCIVLNECLGKISKTGNWYNTAKTDFTILRKKLDFDYSNLNIHLNHFQNAGATPVQQLSYAISQLLVYAKNKVIDPEKNIYYNISVSTNFYIEIAKLRALRVLHQVFAATLNINPNCKLIQHKSKRNLSGLFSEINIANSNTERHIAILGGVNYHLSTPINFFFYKEDIPTIETLASDLEDSNTSSSITEGSVYIEKLTQQLIEKSILLIETIEKGGGFVEQLKKETIQRKISDSEKVAVTTYLKNTKESNLNLEINTKKTAIAYPFLKFKKRKTLWAPIIEKQLRETIERPIWEQHFNL